MYTFIHNPANGKRVSLNSQDGKHIIQKYISHLMGGSQAATEASHGDPLKMQDGGSSSNTLVECNKNVAELKESIKNVTEIFSGVKEDARNCLDANVKFATEAEDTAKQLEARDKTVSGLTNDIQQISEAYAEVAPDFKRTQAENMQLHNDAVENAKQLETQQENITTQRELIMEMQTKLAEMEKTLEECQAVGAPGLASFFDDEYSSEEEDDM